MAQRVPIDPDKGIDGLVRQLADDSRRLVSDEVRLARIEAMESAHAAGRGALWLGLAFGALVITLVAVTLFGATLIGRVANGNYWLGALITAVVEIAIGGWLVKRGLSAFGAAPYSMPDARTGIRLIRGG